MASADVTRFRRSLARLKSVVLDTNVLIYHLEGLAPYLELTRVLITRLGEGELQGVISTVTLAELLVGPYREGDKSRVAVAREFVAGMPNTTLADVDAEVADRAAWLRTHGMRMPDALVAATAVVHTSDAIVTNDPDLKRRIRGLPSILMLDDYCSG